jgi:putative SOS response-associated peptidase YedK
VPSCTIITTDANAFMGEIHDRMPVIIGAEDWAAWLGDEPLGDPAALLKPFPAERMMMWPVDKRIGNVKNQGAVLAEPISI